MRSILVEFVRHAVSYANAHATSDSSADLAAYACPLVFAHDGTVSGSVALPVASADANAVPSALTPANSIAIHGALTRPVSAALV